MPVFDRCGTERDFQHYRRGAEFRSSQERLAARPACAGRFLAPLEILPFDEAAMRRYGSLRSHLERSGTTIGALDLLIAVHALSVGCTLISNHLHEFNRVPDLAPANWVGE